MEPGPPALGVRSLSHWTSREVLVDVCCCQYLLQPGPCPYRLFAVSFAERKFSAGGPISALLLYGGCYVCHVQEIFAPPPNIPGVHLLLSAFSASVWLLAARSLLAQPHLLPTVSPPQFLSSSLHDLPTPGQGWLLSVSPGLVPGLARTRCSIKAS